MPSFTYTAPDGQTRTVRAADEGTARKFLASQTTHPDPTGAGSKPYTSTQLANIHRERTARAALLTLQEER